MPTKKSTRNVNIHVYITFRRILLFWVIKSLKTIMNRLTPIEAIIMTGTWPCTVMAEHMLLLLDHQ